MTRPATGRCAWINCGKDFAISTRGPIPEYCSRTCQVAAHHRRYAKRSSERLVLNLEPDDMANLTATADRLIYSKELLAKTLIRNGLGMIESANRTLP